MSALGLIRVVIARRWMSKAASLAPPCFRAAHLTDGPGDGGIHVRPGAGDDARVKGGAIELVLGIEVQRHISTSPTTLTAPCRAGGAGNDRRSVVVGFHIDALAVDREVVPVERHQAEGRRRSAMSFAPAIFWSSFSGRFIGAEQPVRSIHRIARKRAGIEDIRPGRDAADSTWRNG